MVLRGNNQEGGETAGYDLNNFEVDGSDETVYPLIICDQMMLKAFRQHGVIGFHISSPSERTDPHSCQWAMNRSQAEWLMERLQACLADLDENSTN